MKKTVTNFTFACLLLIFSSINSYSSVIIEDVDFQLGGECCYQYSIEGQDLNISFWGWDASAFQIDGNQTVQGLVDQQGSTSLVAMDAGSTVSTNSQFVPASDFGSAYYGGFIDGGIFSDGETKYFGFQVLSSGNTFYGWFSATRNVDGVILNQIAYEDQAGVSITTGDLADSILEASSSSDGIHKIRLFPNPASELISISVNSFASEENVLVVKDLAGKNVIKTFIYDSKKIDVSSLDTGIYILTVNGGSQRFIKL